MEVIKAENVRAEPPRPDLSDTAADLMLAKAEIKQLRAELDAAKHIIEIAGAEAREQRVEIGKIRAALKREGFDNLETMIAKYKTVMLAANETSIEQDEEIEKLKADLAKAEQRETALIADVKANYSYARDICKHKNTPGCDCDIGCTDCTLSCGCKTCEQNSNFEWQGIPAGTTT